MSYFVFCLCVSCGGSVAPVAKERELVCLLSFTFIRFLFGEVSSSSGCLGRAMLFYCGTP